MADFRIEHVGHNRLVVHKGQRVALVFKHGENWAIQIGKEIAAQFPACTGCRNPRMVPCDTLGTCHTLPPREFDIHIAKYCHQMHGPRAAVTAAAMLGSVIKAMPRPEELRAEFDKKPIEAAPPRRRFVPRRWRDN